MSNQISDFERNVEEILRATNIIIQAFRSEKVEFAAGMLAMRAILADYQKSNPEEFILIDRLEQLLDSMGISINSNADKDKN